MTVRTSRKGGTGLLGIGLMAWAAAAAWAAGENEPVAAPAPGPAPASIPMEFAGGHDPKSADFMGRYYEALETAQDGRYREAIPKLEQILREDPTWMAAWESLGWCHWRLGEKDKALALWNRLRAVASDHPMPYLLLGTAALQEKDLNKAIELLRVCLQKEPDGYFRPRLYEVRYTLARALLWNGDPEGVLLLQELLAADPQRSDVRLELARALLQYQRYGEALPHWKALRDMAPDAIEYESAHALCQLHTGAAPDAERAARAVLAKEPGNRQALTILANASEFGADPSQALAFLSRLLEEQKEPREREDTRVRLIRLHVFLYMQDAVRYPLEPAIRLSRERLAENGETLDAVLLLGELYLMDRRYDLARRQFDTVLDKWNAQNLRARRGLFEAHLATREFSQARAQLDLVRAFNPRDPYLHYYEARYASARGDFPTAEKALDRLEQEGARGAVPVLLFPEISRSDFLADALPYARFKEQVQALQQAGFTFIAPGDWPEQIRATRLAPDPENPPAPVFRPLLMTFDTAQRETIQLAAQAARESQFHFALHIPCGRVGSGGPWISWNELQAAAAGARWTAGSALLQASQTAAADAQGGRVYPLPNRLWLADQKRFETTEDYRARVAREFEESRRILTEKIPGPSPATVAYPFGDLGQETHCNVVGASAFVLEQARRTYAIGFVQSGFGYAVEGNDPLLYPRLTVSRWMSGEDLVDAVMTSHPVFLARRMRVEFAVFQGRQYEALRTLDRLERQGYPARPLQALREAVRRRLARRIETAAESGGEKKPAFQFEPRKAYTGVEGEYFKDNQDRSYQRLYALGGLNLAPRLRVEGRTGMGRFEQTVATGVVTSATEKISVSETNVGLKGVYTFSNGVYLLGDTTWRNFGGDASTSEPALGLETQLRPFLPLDLQLRYAHDMEPSALAIQDGITYNLYEGVGVVRLRDWWDFSAAGLRYAYSDDNARDHLNLGTSWLLHEASGFRLGLRYAYATSDEESKAYWSPYQLQRYFVEAAFRGNYLRTYYNLSVRVGQGRESVRPEEKARYDALVVRAAEQNFDPGPAPKQDTQEVLGLGLSLRRPLGKHWVAQGVGSYNKAPNYDEMRFDLGLRYQF